MTAEVRPRLLVIEPYYGGSHKAFLDGLCQQLDVDAILLTLPARKWKMRMQLSAPWFAERVKEMTEDGRCYDAVLCSTFVDVAVLRSLLMQLPGWNAAARFCTYFHENQFVYPGQVKDPSIFQFTAINFTTAIASDSIAFNSRFNRDSFFEGGLYYLKKASDMDLLSVIESIREKSRVIYPGQDYSVVDSVAKGEKGYIPTIVWNHRWEHDKNPDGFFEVLYRLQRRGLEFRLMVLGESFRFQPDCFAKAQKAFADELVHYGYVESYEGYCSLLCQGDIVVSTSVHEFFGISVLEAVRAGCTPLLPERLSYPELFPVEYLYKNGELEERLATMLEKKVQLPAGVAFSLTEPYSWKEVKGDYHSWLFG